MLDNQEYNNIIKEYFSKFKQIKKKAIFLFLENNKNIKFYLQINLEEIPEFLNIINIIYAILNNIYILPMCKICNKRLTYIQVKHHNKYCSRKCATNDIENIQNNLKKFKQTCLQKYGVEAPMQVKEIKEKSEQTCLRKYHVKNIFQAKETQQKFKNTMLKRYGVNYAAQNTDIKEKIKKTNIKKYGGNAPICSDNIKNKIHNTMLDKYGVKYTAQNKELRKKYKKTCLERYGSEESFGSTIIRDKIKTNILNKFHVTNVLQSPEIREKIRQTNLKKFNSEIYCKSSKYFHDKYQKINNWKNYIIPLFTEDEYEGINSKKIYKWKCVKCGTEFEQRLYPTNHLKDIDQYVPRCLKCFPKSLPYSLEEKELSDFCREYFPNLETNNKSFLKPLEVDILISEIKLAIEFNGSYYHQYNGEYGVKPNYHLEKVQLVNKKGYRLIHIWEDEWIKNKDLIKEKLIKVFKNREEFTGNELKLDYSWFNNLNLENYELVRIEKPELVNRDNNLVENCGYLIYKRK